ncbi:MAG: hypothetical protein WAT39_22920 [Planctomycetota bacterium]
MSVRLHAAVPAFLALLGAAAAQHEKAIAYPQRDLLSPFRTPSDAYAPPDEVFRLLRTMQALADAGNAKRGYDADGRESVDDPRWRDARSELARKGLDAGYLAQILRLNRNGADRATAFYGAFFVTEPNLVFELIAHIPGEPHQPTRQAMLPRAIEFLRKNLGRRFGDLDKDQKETLTRALPEPGSPAARAAGITRAPQDADWLHKITLVPFFQLLDLDEAIDQAQGLWFLKEVFTIRLDLALIWLEPALPRIHQLLLAKSATVREQAIGLLQAIGPKDLPPLPADDGQLIAWAEAAAKPLFPPIRNLNDTIVQLMPSPEREAVVAEGTKALEASAIGDPVNGVREDGTRYRGFRVITVPKGLSPLAIPAEAVITTVNGIAISDAASLLKAVRSQLQLLKHPRKLFVEYVLKGESHAVEYRVM